MGFLKFLFRTILSFLAIALVIICVITYIYYAPPPPPSKVVFDIPSLVHKNIDEVRLELGKPERADVDPIDNTREKWSNTYYKNGFSLSIDFNPITRAVSQYMIVIDGKGSYDNVEDILRVGNLSSSNSTYTIETDQSDNKEFSYVIIHINK